LFILFKCKKMKCLYSNEEFVQSRSNQKFANSKNRMKYHNEKKKQIRTSRAYIDRKLHKNYNILSEIMKGKINQLFHREYLKGKDYSFDVLTHYQKHKGNNEQAVYDFLIVEKEGLLNIIRYD
jgi:hypothetical protein